MSASSVNVSDFVALIEGDKMRKYSTEMKRRALEKVLRPGAELRTISREMGIPKDTLYFWMRKAQDGSMDTGSKKGSKRGLQDKHRMVLEARSMKDEDLGRWLRENGLHESQIEAWEREIASALESSEERPGREASLSREIKNLERELHRKDKALAEMSALVVLKKKLAHILGDEDPPK